MSRLKIAIEAVHRACGLVQDIQRVLVSQETIAKSDRSPVTVADFAAQAVISLALNQALPEDQVLGEENADFLRTETAQAQRSRVIDAVKSITPKATGGMVLDAIDRCSLSDDLPEAYWTLDPIDGTKGFLRRGQYAIALAWIERGQVLLGVLGCPELSLDPHQGPGVICSARHGGGARLRSLSSQQQSSMAVSRLDEPAQAAFLESVEAAHSAHGTHARIAAGLGMKAPPVRMDSQCKYAALAHGQGQIYLRLPRDGTYQEKVWDHAAGALLVEEAGGKVSDSNGHPLDFGAGATLKNNTGIVATNGHFHDQVLEAVREALQATD
ncbi:MAG: 3'(2'),5'-bisphosphate nucleotidase [Deltaproteobacteria bacterium]|nr:3'(2'),5'-bisphosphate nucleotidase [Deltaproteobacteria bacterium]